MIDTITSEDDFLALIAVKFPNNHHTLVLGRGDDCAEIACPPQMAVSTDLFVEDVHFRRAYFSPFAIGHKALVVNISDVAAAGARPLGVSVGLVAPVPFPRADAEGILDGMLHAAQAHDIALTGGDLSKGDKLAFCVTIWGAPVIPDGTKGPEAAKGTPKTAATDAKRPRFLRRGPVCPGEMLFVCGRLGLARAGLLALEQDGIAAEKEYPEACAAHLLPMPQVPAGLALASVPGCRLMDVSDGLARDLPRMLRAHGADCGAAISLRAEDVHPEAARYARLTGEDPARFAFLGGEDYALLGCCPAGELDRARKAVRDAAPDTPFLWLGTVTAEKGIVLNGRPWGDAGFDHFG